MSSDLVKKLGSLGLSIDQIGGVMEIIEAREAGRKELGRDRWHKWKAKKDAANVSQRLQSIANVSTPTHASVTPVEDNLQTKNLDGNKEGKKETRASHEAAFRSELSDLDAEHLDAIVSHRRTKNAPVTSLSARLFRKDAAACGLSPADAVDTCVSRGWITVKPEYFQNRKQSPPGGKRSYADVAQDKFGGKKNGSEGIFGGNGDVELIPPSERQSRPHDDHLRGGIARRFSASGN